MPTIDPAVQTQLTELTDNINHVKGLIQTCASMRPTRPPKPSKNQISVMFAGVSDMDTQEAYYLLTNSSVLDVPAVHDAIKQLMSVAKLSAPKEIYEKLDSFREAQRKQTAAINEYDIAMIPVRDDAKARVKELDAELSDIAGIAAKKFITELLEEIRLGMVDMKTIEKLVRHVPNILQISSIQAAGSIPLPKDKFLWVDKDKLDNIHSGLARNIIAWAIPRFSPVK